MLTTQTLHILYVTSYKLHVFIKLHCPLILSGLFAFIKYANAPQQNKQLKFASIQPSVVLK